MGERKESAGKESYVQERLNGSEKGRMMRERGRNRRKTSGRELEREGERKNNERKREKLRGDFRETVCGRRLERESVIS